MISVMLDIETIGCKPDSIILNLGALKFDPRVPDSMGSGLYLKLDVNEQIQMGRTMDDATIDWWSKQSEEIKKETFSDEGRCSIDDALHDLTKFLVNVDEIWSQGPVFDIGILENLYRQKMIPIPWNYWIIRDCRTLFQIHGDKRKHTVNTLHNVFEDCVVQAKAVQEVFKNLNKEYN